MTNHRIAEHLRHEAERRARMPEAHRDPHRVRAFLKAADAVEVHPEPLTALHARGRLIEVPGVGPKIGRYIANLIDPEERGC